MPEVIPPPDFSDLADLIHERRVRVVRLVNRELVDLYWEIGVRINERIQIDGWGRRTVTQLAEYLGVRVPGLRGFSASNLWRMRQFVETWRDTSEELVTLLRELPWSSHLDLLGRCRTADERQFYFRYAIREDHSVRELWRAIDSATVERVSVADPNLATASRDLPLKARHAFKDSYIVEFLELSPDHWEDDLRRGLVRRLSRDFGTT